VASQLGIRVTYDIHHQRCNELKYESTGTVRENFEKARKTWAGYGYQRLHISSPRDGFVSITKARPHSDYINPVDFPKFLLEYPDVHVDIEAKNKEDAIFTLRDFLKK
jgi:UV DNA damage endonuclease